MFWNQYPYINLNDLNLDFLLKAIGEMQNEVKNFVTLNAVKYANPIQWDITSQYEKNTIVIDPLTGTAYISVQPVPSGVALNRTDYWTPVFDLSRFITQGNENLTEHVEGSGVIYSTFALNEGDWVIWNGVLYKALVNMPIGTAYSIDGNIERVTVEEYIKDILTSITNEVLTRIGADTILQTNIDNEVIARGNADIALQNAIDAITSGIYNNSTPDSGLLTNIGLEEGTYNVDSNLTINAQLVIPKGAIINIAAGVTLTINSSILAGLYQIFTGGGNVVINGESTVYPEWWGAVNDSTTDSTDAFKKAIAAIEKGEVVLQSGKYNIYTTPKPLNAYVISDTLNLNKNNVAIKGIHRACIISTATTTINIEGSSDNGSLNFVQGHYIENVIFYYDGTPVTPTAYNEIICIRNHASIRNYIKFCEFYNFNTAYYSDTIVANYFINNTVHVPNFVYCTGVYLNDNIINGAIYPNASQHIEDCIFLCGDSSVGVTAIGDVLSDLFVRNNEFGGGYRSISMSIGSGASSTPTSYDIHITDNIFDNIADTCIEISFNENENSALIISRNWIAHRNNNAITLQRVHNAVISDNVINGTLGASTYGMALVYCKNITVKGNIIEACVRGIDTAIGSLYVFTDNQFIAFNDSKTYEVAFRLTSAVNNCFIGNNLIDGDNKPITNGVVVQGAPNIINWNIAKNAPNSIATGNVVNGVTI